MKQITSHENAVSKMLKLFHALEMQFEAKLTLHDHIGIFTMPDGVKLLPQVNIHRFECCTFWSTNRIRCHNHCSFGARNTAAQTGKAFVSTCFCGVTEVVMPLYYRKIHAATIFAGAYRRKDFDPSAFPQCYRKLYNTLPEWKDSRRDRLETLLESAGYSLMMMADNFRNNYDSEEGRTGQIRRFFRTRFAENVGVADLAAELELSESRTIHILQETFGRGFSQLLTQERLSNADKLLAESDLPLRKIARMTGFSSEFYMSNVFRKAFRIPPGERRRKNRKLSGEE